MSTQVYEYQIVDGPNRNDFVNSFLYAFDENLGLDIAKYKITENNSNRERKVSIRLQEIRHEAYGKTFLFKGVCFYGLPNKFSVDVTGFYDANTRKGYIKAEGVRITI